MRAPLEQPQLTYVGHSTVVIEMNGIRVVTDPLLRARVAHIRRYAPVPDLDLLEPPDVVLLSHLHLDHCDLPSLHRLGTDVRLIAPRGAGSLLRRRGFRQVVELIPGQETAVGPVRVVATFAEHSGFRPPIGPRALAVGFLLTGTQRVYFAGDTGLFPEMAELGGSLDVALLPVWGWGRTLGPGHLDPLRAAQALRLLRPAMAVPIHWGTFAALTLGRNPDRFLHEPPRLFAQYAEHVAPSVVVRIVPPGEKVILA